MQLREKYKPFEFLKERFKKEEAVVLKVFLSYYLLVRGDEAALEWVIDNLPTLSEIRRRTDREYKVAGTVLSRTAAFAKYLKDRDSLREAIVLREILGLPVGLRQPDASSQHTTNS